MRRYLLLTALLIAPTAWSMAPELAGRLCQAAVQEGALAAEIEELMDEGRYPLERAEDLLTLPCEAGRSLLSLLVEGTQAENLEYAVIDMGADVNLPLVQEEGGRLTIVQYLLQQAAAAPHPEVRAFARDYMRELRDVDFNPNLLLVSLN